METDPDRACVIGNGGWGTALALLLLSRGRDVALWGHSKEELDDIRARGENVPYLPGVTVPVQEFRHGSADRFCGESAAGAVLLPVQRLQELRRPALCSIFQAEAHIDPILAHPITPASICVSAKYS